MSRRRKPGVLVTGAGGYIGRRLVAALARDPRDLGAIVALDLRPAPAGGPLPGVRHVTADVRAPELGALLREHEVGAVAHLASIVTPGKRSDRAFEYSVDVGGTRNVLEACLDSGVELLIVTSSGAAYGYHADNPMPLTETDPLRGNPEFAYSDHKRLVEEMLARCRAEHPELRQLIFRPGTVLGAGAANQITALFEKPLILGLRGASSPFVFIWDQDVVACLLKGLHEGRQGIYNLAGDGVLTLREIARRTGKPFLALPVGLLRGALWCLRRLRLTQYGPEQVNFLRYRPVLSNRRLKQEFGYLPRKTTAEAFECFWEARQGGS